MKPQHADQIRVAIQNESDKLCNDFRPKLSKLMYGTTEKISSHNGLPTYSAPRLWAAAWSLTMGQALGYIDNKDEMDFLISMFAAGLKEGREHAASDNLSRVETAS